MYTCEVLRLYKFSWKRQVTNTQMYILKHWHIIYGTYIFNDIFWKCQLLLNDIYTQKLKKKRLEWIVSECKTFLVIGYQTLCYMLLKIIEDSWKAIIYVIHNCLYLFYYKVRLITLKTMTCRAMTSM